MAKLTTDSSGNLPSPPWTASSPDPIEGVTPSGEILVRQITAPAANPVEDANPWVPDVLELDLTVDTNAYAAGDVLAEVQELSLSGLVRGYIESAQVIDPDDQGAAMDIYFFSNADASLGAENAAPVISDAHANSILGRIEVGANDYKDLTGAQHASPDFMRFNFACAGGSIYVGAVIQDTATYAGGTIRLRIGVTGKGE